LNGIEHTIAVHATEKGMGITMATCQSRETHTGKVTLSCVEGSLTSRYIETYFTAPQSIFSKPEKEAA